MSVTPWRGPEVAERIRNALVVGLARGIAIVDQEAVRLILSPPKSGRIYRRRGIEHQASRGGEAPANDTGQLVQNRTTEVIPEAMRARLVFHSEYAPYLQFGTRRMEPRPYLDTAIVNTAPQVFQAITAPIRIAFHES